MSREARREMKREEDSTAESFFFQVPPWTSAHTKKIEGQVKFCAASVSREERADMRSDVDFSWLAVGKTRGACLRFASWSGKTSGRNARQKAQATFLFFHKQSVLSRSSPVDCCDNHRRLWRDSEANCQRSFCLLFLIRLGSRFAGLPSDTFLIPLVFVRCFFSFSTSHTKFPDIIVTSEAPARMQ